VGRSAGWAAQGKSQLVQQSMFSMSGTDGLSYVNNSNIISKK